MNMKGGSSFQDTQEKCCSIEMVEEPEEKFRFRYKSEMQVNKWWLGGGGELSDQMMI